jgi:translation initiation factor 1A
MPNLKGGKKYKSGKHLDQKPEFHEIGLGQMAARVLKHLGDRNILVYCNDGKERVAHIRGGLSKKKAIIEVGDIVLISIRSSEMDTTGTSQDRGDVLAKYAREVWNQLKKVENINLNLFVQVERMDRTKIKSALDEAFEFEEDAGEELSGEESEDEMKAKRDLAHQAEEKKRATARDNKQQVGAGTGDDDFNIDDI